MKLADLTFGERDDRHPGKTQMLEQGGDICLIAADAVEGFRHHDIEHAALRVLQKLLNARTQDHARTRYRGVVIGADDRPCLALGLLPAKPELVLDRAFALIVRRIAGIKRNAGHGTYLRFFYSSSA